MRIAPDNRLLIWSAALLPAAAAGAMFPAAAPLALALYGALAVAAVIDAAFGLRALAAVGVELPETVRLSRDREGGIPMRLRGGGQTRLRVGVPLPDAFRSPVDTLDVELSASGGDFDAQWPCTPTARGRFQIDRCHVEVASPLAMWRAMGERPARCEVRVYPGLMDERRRLAGLFLNRGAFGVHAQRMVGHGREFEKLREYVPGDHYEDIHWKATAKRGHPVTKLYQVERTQEVYTAVDASRLSARPSGGEPALERFISAALILGLAAEQQGDLFGVLTFDDRARAFLRASGGARHYQACRDALYTLMPGQTSPDFRDFFTFVRLNLRRRALVVVLTDLGDPLLAEDFLEHVDLICRHHLVLVAMIRPPELRPLFSGAPAQETDQLYQELGGHLVWSRLRELGRALGQRGVRFVLVDDGRLGVDLVSQYVEIKARQAL